MQALKNVTFSVEEGEFVAIMGESGSGKTTLLNILASLDRPTEGEVLLEGKSIVHLTEKRDFRFSPQEPGLRVPGFQSSGHLQPPGQYLSASRAGGENYREMEQKIRPISQALALQSFWKNSPTRFPADRSREWQWREL